jgi:hypothetical protein
MISLMNGATIQEFKLRCKSALEQGIGEWGLIIVIFLVAFGAFGLGRLSALEQAQAPIAIAEAPVDMQPPAITPGGYVVASQTGSVYYFPWCAGAQKIAAAQQEWFSSEAAAQKAGYRPAQNCKGLAGE